MLLLLLLLLRLACLCLGTPPALFVFGDSYADTGNHDRHNPRLFSSWRRPYGSTWPGHPQGRFSDGKVLTDFVASFLNLSSPLPYRERGFHPELIFQGINFAFGGSGVFRTYGPEYPTIDAQIQQLSQLFKTGLYTKGFFERSALLFVYSGNDYAAYVSKHPTTEGITSFIPEVVNQIGLGLQKLHILGFRKFAVTNLEPTGCLPLSTCAENFSSCKKRYNVLTSLHNKLLKAKILELQNHPGFDILLLNQYRSFLRALNITSATRGTKNIFQPCCMGARNFSCGATDTNGKPLYTVCSSPGQAFFWDSSHPTQAGWKTVTKCYKSKIIRHFGRLKNTLSSL